MMCGRFTQTGSPAGIAAQLHPKELPLFKARYDIAPSQSVGAIRMMPIHIRMR